MLMSDLRTWWRHLAIYQTMVVEKKHPAEEQTSWGVRSVGQEFVQYKCMYQTLQRQLH